MRMNKTNFEMKSHEFSHSDEGKGESISLCETSEGACIGGNFKNEKNHGYPNSQDGREFVKKNKNDIGRDENEIVAMDPVNRDSIILHYTPLVEFVANRIARHLPSYFEVNDLISSGVLGLIDAIEKYDPTREVQFKTYAEVRIRGAILDELRSMDRMPRSVRENANKINRAKFNLEQELCRPVHDWEVAEGLEIEIDEFQTMTMRAAALSMLSLDKVIGRSGDGEECLPLLDKLSGLDEDDPQSKHAFAELKQKVGKTIDTLPEQERLVLSLYYYEEMKMKEIGQVMEVTESRVSQIHKRAVAHLRERLGLYLAYC